MPIYPDELVGFAVLKTITIPLFAPSRKEFPYSRTDLSYSSLNACYSKPKVNAKTGEKRSWFDVEFFIDDQQDLPSSKEWFYLVTDVGDWYKAHFTGKKVKKLSIFRDNNVIGHWIKGRLVEWDLLNGFDYVYEDKNWEGIITKEMLRRYGNNKVYLKKINKYKRDEKGIRRDVWVITFPYTIRSLQTDYSDDDY